MPTDQEVVTARCNLVNVYENKKDTMQLAGVANLKVNEPQSGKCINL